MSFDTITVMLLICNDGCFELLLALQQRIPEAVNRFDHVI